MRALFPDVATETLALNVDLATYETFNFGRRRLAGAVLGLIGLVLDFSARGQRCRPVIRSNISNCGNRADSARATDLHNDSQIDSSDRVPGRALILFEGIVSALIGVVVLILFVPLKFLHHVLRRLSRIAATDLRGADAHFESCGRARCIFVRI